MLFLLFQQALFNLILVIRCPTIKYGKYIKNQLVNKILSLATNPLYKALIAAIQNKAIDKEIISLVIACLTNILRKGVTK
jgi:hypothetical protein